MQNTIDFLVKDNRIKEVNKLMGDNLPWESKVLEKIKTDIESELDKLQ